jgi:hypothetical protein
MLTCTTEGKANLRHCYPHVRIVGAVYDRIDGMRASFCATCDLCAHDLILYVSLSSAHHMRRYCEPRTVQQLLDEFRSQPLSVNRDPPGLAQPGGGEAPDGPRRLPTTARHQWELQQVQPQRQEQRCRQQLQQRDKQQWQQQLHVRLTLPLH